MYDYYSEYQQAFGLYSSILSFVLLQNSATNEICVIFFFPDDYFTDRLLTVNETKTPTVSMYSLYPKDCLSK